MAARENACRNLILNQRVAAQALGSWIRAHGAVASAERD
jgi:hypothetical protein